MKPRPWRIIPMRGRRFGRLIVAPCNPTRRGRLLLWTCLCSCGRSKKISGTSLRLGLTRSCGCLQKEAASFSSKKHGLCKKVPEYRVWKNIRDRCRRGHHKKYFERGIKICREWDNFAKFLKDMGPRPSKVHSIDRIDNDGPYSPENCRWALPETQANNKRTTIVVNSPFGRITLARLARKLDVKYSYLYRLYRKDVLPGKVQDLCQTKNLI